ncbi:cysteine desulfurase family protein [Amorphus orientalis]|uniref:Cysteine desulfurase n=1 Tax=Amorphus orientalis TaxID=649198 RepID=A0AAE4AWE9_9HYPH|nr:cysteine desulfurase family protein [Amorphus orientalis]MDQ0317699.1 cysteine desulfurase [Amorphus orientalis]
MTAASRIYFDWNAGAPVKPAVREAMVDALSVLGNPSSVHAEGRAARARIEEARRAVADLAGTAADAVTFTSGGTEANVTALSPEMEIDGQPVRFSRLLVSAIEHPSVLAGGRFPAEAVSVLPVDADGRLDLDALDAALADADGPMLVSLMAANNETGVLQPVAEAADRVHAAGGVLHVDAVQVAGREAIPAATTGADILTLSAHKIGGPRGAGAVIRVRPGLRIAPLLTGGGQEGRDRAGTENMPAIAAFGVAAREAMSDVVRAGEIRRLRDWLERDVMIMCPDAVVFGRNAGRLANTSCLAVPGMTAETAVIALDLDGVAVSSGAACSSGKVAASHVLAAMGVPGDLARGAVRISLGPSTTEAEVEQFISVWRKLRQRFARQTGQPEPHSDRLRQPAGLEPAMDGETDAGSAGNDRSGSVDRHRQVQVRVRHGHSVRQGA